VNYVSAVGALLALSVVFIAGLPNTESLCRTKPWLLSIAFTLLFGALFSKTWRVHMIFNQTTVRVVKISDSQLMWMIAALVAVDVVVLALWDGLSQSIVVEQRDAPIPGARLNELVVKVYAACSSESGSVPYLVTLAVLKGALLLFGSKLAFDTRNVKIPVLNDAKWIGMSVYTSTLVIALIVPVLFAVRDDAQAAYVFLSIGIFLVTTCVVGLLYVPKFIMRARSGEMACEATPGTVTFDLSRNGVRVTGGFVHSNVMSTTSSHSAQATELSQIAALPGTLEASTSPGASNFLHPQRRSGDRVALEPLPRLDANRSARKTLPPLLSSPNRRSAGSKTSSQGEEQRNREEEEEEEEGKEKEALQSPSSPSGAPLLSQHDSEV
jgi:gamma-aminobutyric acid type B receptor